MNIILVYRVLPICPYLNGCYLVQCSVRCAILTVPSYSCKVLTADCCKSYIEIVCMGTLYFILYDENLPEFLCYLLVAL